MSFARVVIEEGGEHGFHDVATLVAAFKHCAKCIVMGKTYLSWNDFTERYDFWYNRKRMKNKFKQEWQMKRREFSTTLPSAGGGDGGGGGGGGGGASAPTSSCASSAVAQSAEHSQDAQKKTPAKKPPAKTKPKAAPKKTESQLILEAASKSMNKYKSVMSSAEGVDESLQSDWKWLKKLDDAEVFAKQMILCKGLVTPLANDFRVLDLAGIKKKHKDNMKQLLADAKLLPSTIDQPIQTLQDSIDTLIALDESKRSVTQKKG